MGTSEVCSLFVGFTRPCLKPSHEQSEQNTMNNDNKIIFGAFTQDEAIALKEEFKLYGNPNVTLRKIATPLLRRKNLRAWEEGTEEEQEEIQTQFFNIQDFVVVTEKMKVRTVEHLKGDPIRDAQGNPITDGTMADGSPRVKTYPKNTVERVETPEEVPFFDRRHSMQALKELERRLRMIEILPDYDTLRQEFLANVDFQKGCDIIRNLTDFYIFEEPEKFVERFALLVCNAKAKALGFQPKWPVMFSLVGKMGVGKSWFADKLKETYDKTFGCRSGVTSYSRLLDSTFNAMMGTRGFLSLDEAQGLDKTQCEKLKTFITSTKVEIERKGIDSRTCDNLVTFFSATNESVKDVMGYQPDRRIVEFIISEKKGEIPEEDIVRWFEEIWRVMPVEHPNQDKIKEELLETSVAVLDENMSDVVFEIFRDSSYDTYANKRGRLNIFKFKRAVKEIGSVPYVRVRDWCVEQGIINRTADGRMNLSKKRLNDFLADMEYEKRDAIVEELGL